jgi:hypothetical protein
MGARRSCGQLLHISFLYCLDLHPYNHYHISQKYRELSVQVEIGE